MRLAALGAAKLRLVILDACRNDPFRLAPPPGQQKHRALGGTGLANPGEPEPNELIAYAAKEGTQSLDGKDGHSPFAAALLKELAQPGAEIGLLFRRVRDDVQTATGNYQKPFTYGSLGGEEIYLNPSVAKAVPAAAEPPKVALVTPPPAPVELLPAPQEVCSADNAVMVAVGGQDKCLHPGDAFRDIAGGPEMVVMPKGSFTMGSNQGYDDEKPPHPVTIAKPFAVGKYDVTFAEWDKCVAEKGCTYKPDDNAWGRGNRRVINVSWDDVSRQYLPWLSKRTGQTYRLLSETEWEYAARAGTQTTYYWGSDIGEGNANCDRCGSKWDNKQTAPVGSFKANSFGLYDMAGNVWQWVEDGYHSSYADNPPKDGSVWEVTGAPSLRVLRGGSWLYGPRLLRSAYRFRSRPGNRSGSVGFRLARTL